MGGAHRAIARDGCAKNVIFQALPDLMPVASAPGYCNLQDGQLVVVVANQGPVDAPASTTEVRFSTESGPQSIQLPTPAIPANSSVEVLFNIPGACWDPDCNFEIRVDVLNQVYEAIENNNLAAGACAG